MSALTTPATRNKRDKIMKRNEHKELQQAIESQTKAKGKIT
jgi:hypothetical protein